MDTKHLVWNARVCCNCGVKDVVRQPNWCRPLSNSTGSWLPSPIPVKGTSVFSKHQLMWGLNAHATSLLSRLEGGGIVIHSWSIGFLTLRLNNSILAYSLNSNKMGYISIMWTFIWIPASSHSVSFTVFKNLQKFKKYLTTCYSFFNYSNRSSVSTKLTTCSTVLTPVRSPGTKPTPSHVDWQRVSCFEDR